MSPLRVTLLFLCAGGVLLFPCAMLLPRYAHPPTAPFLVLYNGLFLVVSALCLHGLLRSHVTALRRSEQRLIDRNRELTAIDEDLRRSHQQFVALVDSIEGIVWECDASTLRFTFVSQRAERMLGFPVTQWIGDPSFWLDHLHPDDRHQAYRDYMAAVRERKDACLEHRVVTASGGTIWVRNNVSVVTHEDGGVSLCGVMYDITLQKRAEERIHQLNTQLEQRVLERTAEVEDSHRELQAIFKALPDLFFSIDSTGTILDFRGGAFAGPDDAFGTVTGRNIRDSFPHHIRQQLDDALEALSVDRALSSFEYETGEENGAMCFEARLLPFTDDRTIVLLRNITDRKRAEREISALNEDLQRRAIQLQEINHELESFSYSVSHDLRTPLRHIDGFSKALQEDCGDLLDEEGKMYVSRVRVAAQRMGMLIDDMLKLASVSSSDLVCQSVNLSSLARIIAVELQQSQQERNVDFAIEDDVIAWGDPRLLRVVLTNLIENAWKYTGNNGRAQICFGARREGHESVYYIRDNGAGFDMAYAGKLFAAFQRLHGVEEFEGNGIGLATVQRVIRRHGGRVWGEGAVGQGATFFFTLGGSDR